MVKVGDEYHKVDVNERTGKIEWQIWVVRTIRGGKIHATFKGPGTWGKVSKKHGDFGWLPNIPAYCRESWSVGSESGMLRKTKIQALEHSIKMQRKYGEDDDFPEGMTNEDAVARLERTLASLRTKRKKDR